MINKVILIGNVTKDPEVAETSGGVTVGRFSLAVNRNYTDKDGNRECDFFNVVVWRGQAEICGKYLKKGKKVAVVGSLQNRSFTDKEGAKRNVTEIEAREIEFLSPAEAEEPKPKKEKTAPELEPGNLPF